MRGKRNIVQSHNKKKTNDQAAKAQHIEAHSIYDMASRTHQTASTSFKRSLEEAARFLEDALRVYPRQTGRRVVKSARSGANFALCYEHVTASKQFPKSEGSSYVRWRLTSCGPHTNATPQKGATHANATDAEDSPGPTLGLQQSLLASHQKQQYE